MSRYFDSFVRFIATCGGVGYAPYAPGSVATVLSVCFWWYICGLSSLYQLLVLISLFFIGVVCSKIVAHHDAIKDPSYVVIDEWVGMGVGLFVMTKSWWYVLVACLLFRFFDITKIWFISLAEKIPGGWGIMLDDILAGLYTLIIMQLLCCFL